MSEFAEPKLLIIEPDGAQGSKLTLGVLDQQQFEDFSKAVGNLKEAERHDLQKLSSIARELGIQIIKA